MAHKCNTRKKLKPQQRTEVYQKTGGHCAYCGCALKYKDMCVDHVISIRRGGTDIMDNMMPSCRSCNFYKDTLTLDGFRQRIEKAHDTLMRDNAAYKNAVRFGVIAHTPRPVKFYFENVTENSTNGGGGNA